MNMKKLVVALSLLAVLVAASVASVGALTPMQVASLNATYAFGRIKANVSVVDALSRPIPGAYVQVSFEKTDGPSYLRTVRTSLAGLAAPSIAATAGNWTVCVEEIHKIGFTYDPIQNVCTSIVVP